MSWIWIILAIFLTASAQIALKIISRFDVWSLNWIIGISLSILLYLAAFIVYSYILRFYNISIVSPLMTISVLSIIVVAGILLGEVVSLRQFFGLVLSLFSVILLLW